LDTVLRKDKPQEFKTGLLLPAPSLDLGILNKYESFKGSKVKALKWLRKVTDSYPNLFYHWGLDY